LQDDLWRLEYRNQETMRHKRPWISSQSLNARFLIVVWAAKFGMIVLALPAFAAGIVGARAQDEKKARTASSDRAAARRFSISPPH
jgi:hypothetical protein